MLMNNLLALFQEDSWLKKGRVLHIFFTDSDLSAQSKMHMNGIHFVKATEC